MIYIDGIKVAKLRLYEPLILELSDGNHTVRARMDWVTCRPLVVTVDHGSSHEVEISMPLWRLPLAIVAPWRGYVARES
jgi:hypothetical protein